MFPNTFSPSFLEVCQPFAAIRGALSNCTCKPINIKGRLGGVCMKNTYRRNRIKLRKRSTFARCRLQHRLWFSPLGASQEKGDAGHATHSHHGGCPSTSLTPVRVQLKTGLWGAPL